MSYNSEEESPMVFIDDIVDINSGEHLPTEMFGEEILEMIGETSEEDLEYNEKTHVNIAHKKDVGIDIYYRVGFQTK